MSENGHSGPPDPAAPRAAAPAARPLSRWKKFRMVVKVVELRLRFIALLAATGLVFAYWDTLWNHYDKWMRPPAEKVAAAAGIEYYCPMHPQVIRDEPGSCPICGMPLAKRKKGEKEALPEGVLARVQSAPIRIQQAGIKTVEVGYAPLTETLTTVGTVEYDERKLAHIASKIPGMSRVEKLYVNFTGVNVQQGAVLAELYSPELYQATQELLISQRRAGQAASGARSALGARVMGDPNELVRLSIEKLKLWGINQAQIDKMLREGHADYRMPIHAPIRGHVVKKNIVEGQYVQEGQPLFEVADLSTVWVKAQVYEDQVGLVHEGQEVEATVEAFPGQVFRGKVAFVQPHLDPATRTVEVRYDLENPSHQLRPGMFATVTLKTPVAETPMFQKVVRRAPASRPGQATVRRARRTAEEPKTCPVTGAPLGSMGDPVAVEVRGQTVRVCCEGCTPKLKSDPDKYLAKLAPPPKDAVLSVPEAAVIDTGVLKMVYVETEPGVFEGRKVVLGPRSGDRYPVLEGLAPGEKVVAAGAFLVDAESRLNPTTRPDTSPEGDAPAPTPIAAGNHHHREG
ncbi:MAG: efflux RND transporter periplasmic adaptor subunit [Isosphaeraceae bacterium]|nr:efflux RND transporter periplasmic adaptor subunit [Isosphaeraceae bacterium]